MKRFLLTVAAVALVAADASAFGCRGKASRRGGRQTASCTQAAVPAPVPAVTQAVAYLPELAVAPAERVRYHRAGECEGGRCPAR